MNHGQPSQAPSPGGAPVWSRLLVQGSILSFTLRILGTGAAFLCQLVLARHLGDAGYGDYAFAISIVSVAALVAMAGFGNALLRYSGEYQATSQSSLLRGIHVVAVLTGAGVAVLAGAALSWSSRNAVFGLSVGQAEALSVGSYLVLPVALMGLGQAALIGFKRPGLGSAVETLIRPTLLAAGFLVVARTAATPPRPPVALAVDLVAVAVTAALAIAVSWRDLARLTRGFGIAYRPREWYRVSIPLLLMTGWQVLFNHTDVIMLGAIAGPESTGNYAVASRVSRLVLFGLSSVNAIAAPMISELYHGGRHKELQHLLRRTAWAILGFTALAGLVVGGAGRMVLGWFGPEFGSAFVPLLVLLVGQVTNALAGPVAYLMTLTGRQDQAARIMAVCALVNIALNAILIPGHGATGAAAATAVTVAAWNIAMLITVRRLLGFNPTVFGKGRT